MYCRQCGHELRGDERFCTKCGVVSLCSRTKKNEFTKEDLKKKKRNMIIAIVVFIAVIVIILL